MKYSKHHYLLEIYNDIDYIKDFRFVKFSNEKPEHTPYFSHHFCLMTVLSFWALFGLAYGGDDWWNMCWTI